MKELKICLSIGSIFAGLFTVIVGLMTLIGKIGRIDLCLIGCLLCVLLNSINVLIAWKEKQSDNLKE